jgi:hypothetical protein
MTDGPTPTHQPISANAKPVQSARQDESPLPRLRQIDPENQGLISALLDGAMRQGNLEELEDLVGILLERNVRNLPVLYELAQEEHPGIPTWEQLLDMAENG